MATDLQIISHYLDNREWKYRVENHNDRIITGVQADNIKPFAIGIQLRDNGKYIEFIVPQLLHVKDHVFKGPLFQTMLAIAWEIKMIRWQYDPSDGEVRATIEFLLEDALLTEQQFNRILDALINILDEYAMPRLLSVLHTGNDPGAKPVGEMILDALEAILPDGSLELLVQALNSRQINDSY